MISSTRTLLVESTNPHHNLALEEALMETLPSGQALLMLWQNRHTVVVGAGQNAWRECRTQTLAQEGGTLARRSSGGGAVYHDLGNLNYSFILPPEDYSVARQSNVVLRALKAHGLEAERSGRNDLTIDGRKFSGNAFRMLKTSALQHGTLLIASDMSLVGRYLNVPPSKLAAKGVKSVRSRVVNLSELANVSVESMQSAMIDAFRAEYGEGAVEQADDLEFDDLPERTAKYASWTWNYGASPEGDAQAETRFSWGGVEIVASVLHGQAAKVSVFTDAMDETLKPRLEAALTGALWRGDALSERAEQIGETELAAWLRGVA